MADTWCAGTSHDQGKGVRIVIHTDGACRGNPGPGGWGAILNDGGTEKEIRGYDNLTTNNRMELTAAVEALAALTRSCKVDLYTDSKYVQQGITEWIDAWKIRNWKTASRKPVKNVDLWMVLDNLAGKHDINWQWVKGHAGNAGNERADLLANMAIDEAQASARPSAGAAGK